MSVGQILTENHLVMTGKGWKEAGDLLDGEEIMTVKNNNRDGSTSIGRTIISIPRNNGLGGVKPDVVGRTKIER